MSSKDRGNATLTLTGFPFNLGTSIFYRLIISITKLLTGATNSGSNLGRIRLPHLSIKAVTLVFIEPCLRAISSGYRRSFLSINFIPRSNLDGGMGLKNWTPKIVRLLHKTALIPHWSSSQQQQRQEYLRKTSIP